MKIKAKIILGFSAITIFTIAITLGSVAQMGRMAEPLHTVIPAGLQEIGKANALHEQGNDIRYYDEVLTQSARNYAFTKDKKWKERYLAVDPELGKAIKKAILIGDEQDKEAFRNIDAANVDLVRMEAQALNLVDRGMPQEAVSLLDSAEYWNKKKGYENWLNKYFARKEELFSKALLITQDNLEQEVKKADDKISWNNKFTIIVLGIALLLAAFWSVLISKAITRPIAELADFVSKVGKGNLDVGININSKDEIGHLAQAFNKMLADLRMSTISMDKLNAEIDEHKKAELQLTESESRYKMIFNLSRDAIMLMTPEDGFFSGNPAAVEIFGCKNEQIFFGMTLDALSPEYQPDGVSSMIKAKQMMDLAMKNGYVFSPWKHKRLTGEEFFAVVSLVRMELKGRIILHTTVRDVSEQKIAEEKLQLAAEEWKTTFDSITSLVSLQDKNFKVIRVNKAYAEALKRKPEELIGKTCYEVIHGTKQPWPTCPHAQTLKTRKETKEEFFDPRLGLFIEVSTSPIFDKRGEVIGTVHIVNDISERKRVEAKVAEAIEVKSQFISMVSHELRTPLTAIREGIGIVSDGSAGEINADQSEFLDLAKRNVDRLSRLINDVLDYQKLEAGRADFNMQETDVNLMINDVIKVMQPVAKAKNLTIEFNQEGGLPRVIMDSDKVTQVLINLVNNAIKFTEQGKVGIVVNRDNNMLKVSVKDTGVGIKEQDIPKLFQGFSQVDAGRNQKKGSTGLGLAISRKIILEHHGEMWIESEYGKGSDFIFTLPVRTQFSVLVIDDEEEILSACRQFLEKMNFAVACTTSGLEAIGMVAKNKPDIILLDMRLKDINGYEIIGRLRSVKETARIPIVVISAHIEEITRLKDWEDDFALLSVSKPFDFEVLLANMRLLLKQKV